MVEMHRRSVLALGALSVVGGSISSEAHASSRRRQNAAKNPVLFWHAVSLDLVALDHSIEPMEARAPGPCASARALGLVHSVIADAVSIAYPAQFRPQFYRGKVEFDIEVPALFVGGAAAGILSYIFHTPIHAYLIGAKRDEFQKQVGNNKGRDWQAGLTFASSRSFRDLWNWAEMQRLLLPQTSNYIPEPRRHSIDPYNAGQGFYGAEWGGYRPLVLRGEADVARLGPGAPPPEGSPEYERDLAEVRVKGALVSRSDSEFRARTEHELNVGLFWAYDGARLLGTPPRLYNQIVTKVAVDDGIDISEMARLLALCNLAMADAAIVSWQAKYKYRVWRPVMGIPNHWRTPLTKWQPLGSPKTNPTRFAPELPGDLRETAQSLMGGGASVLASQLRVPADYKSSDKRPVRMGTAYRDAAFTPNFPAYPSGHSTFGGACFHVLKMFRRSRPQTHDFPDRIRGPFISDELNGISGDHFRNEPRPYYPIDYSSIDAMIEDNDLSRIYLGVHWRFDTNRGSASGRRIAEAVYNGAYNVAR